MTEPEGAREKCVQKQRQEKGSESPSRNNRRGRGCPERILPLYLRAADGGGRGRPAGQGQGGRVANVWHISAFKEDCICYACVAPLRFNGNRSRVNILPPQRAVAGSERVRNLVGLSECTHLLRREEPCTIRSTCVCGISKCKWNDLLPAHGTLLLVPCLPLSLPTVPRNVAWNSPPLTSPGTLSLLLSSVPGRSRLGSSSYRIRLMLLGRLYTLPAQPFLILLQMCRQAASSPSSSLSHSLFLPLSVCKRNITCRTSNLLASF